MSIYLSRNKGKGKFVFMAAALMIFSSGCKIRSGIARDNLPEILSKIGRDKYQSRISCRTVGETFWAYLPYTPGRSGLAGTKEKDNDLFIEYQIASFNPYKTIEPPELKFLAQKLLGEIRKLLLGSANPYKFFILVVTDISNPKNKTEEWYLGYFNDLKDYRVGIDFSGESYSRLVWSLEEVAVDGEQGVSSAYRDAAGQHVNYHEMTLREFVNKQIKWRIYKRFTIEYNKTPFDFSAQEKENEVINIIKKVLTAYNFEEFENFYLKDSSFLDEDKAFVGFPRENIEKYKTPETRRKPAF